MRFSANVWLWSALVAGVLLASGHRLALTRSRPNVLRFSHTFTTESERSILAAVVAEFESTHPGVRVEQHISNSEVYNTVGWRLQFHGRKQPDIFFHWQGFKVEECIARGWAMDLAPLLSAGTLEQFSAAGVRSQRNGIYFLPQSFDLSALVWYNRDTFDRLGLAEPRTMEEWLALCAKLRAAQILPAAQGNRDLWPMGNFAAELAGQTLGAEAFARLFAPGRPIAESEARGLATLVALRDGGAFELRGVLERGAVEQLGDIDAKILFLSGKSAMHIVGSWFLADVQDARAKGELKFTPGVFAAPAETGGHDVTAGVTTGFLVNPATKNPRAAVAFLELLLSRKYQERFATLGNLSARRDAADFTSDPLARRLLDLLAATRALVPPPDTGYRPEQAAVFYELCGKLLAAKLELQQVVPEWNREKQSLARKGL